MTTPTSSQGAQPDETSGNAEHQASSSEAALAHGGDETPTSAPGQAQTTGEPQPGGSAEGLSGEPSLSLPTAEPIDAGGHGDASQAELGPDSPETDSASAPRYGVATEGRVSEVIAVADRYATTSIIALAGVPGTGKSYVAQIAAQRIAGEPTRVREVQFHPSTTYEEFVEGLRIDASGAIEEMPGLFAEWNQFALDDPSNTYVLLIDELTRANLSAVMGELLTFVEDRRRTFTSLYSRRPMRVAENLVILATYNPTDRSAIEIDGALLRRLRIIRFDPDEAQLREMLAPRLSEGVIERLASLFTTLKAKHRDFEDLMPFGHGVFAEVVEEAPDLYQLWEQRIRYFLYRPLVSPHAYADDIREGYPWTDPSYREPDVP